MPVRTVAGIVLALVGVITVAVFAARAQRQQANAARSVQDTLEMQQHLADLLVALNEAESGQRGYLLTGSDPYLGPYTLGTARAGQELAQLRPGTSDNPTQQRTLGELEGLVRAKLAELAETVEQARGGLRDGAVARVQSGEGQKLMDRIRTAVRTMQGEEGRLLAERAEAWRTRAQRTSRAIVLGAFGLFLLTLLAGLGSIRDYREQKEARRVAEALASELSAQTQELQRLVTPPPKAGPAP
jgi:CHASE3 domain sensor protein